MKNRGPINSMQEAKNFWETCHQAESIVHLSGVDYDRMISFMHLSDHIKPGKTVLETGVGMGYVTKGLLDAGALPSALDISQTALKRVEQYCEEVYLVEDLERMPSDYFDIILCCNMVQHVHTELLKEELEHFMRSLKDDGILAIQFVSNDKHPDTGVAATLSNVQAGTLCRSPDIMQEIFASLNGECKHVFNVGGLRKGLVNGNHVFHVTKQSVAKKKKKKKDKDKKNPSAQIRNTHGYSNPHDY